MTYFKANYRHLHWAKEEEGRAGFRPPQIAALHLIAAHFLQHTKPAIITMPTGSGKTAVLEASSFALEAERVLVITPSRLVREQIVEGFTTLGLLKRLEAVEADVPIPSVINVSHRITSIADWQALATADVVVGTPSSLSPEIEGIPDPPADLFDLVLIDEAHHSPATTWAALLSHFPRARRILFTATPFRQDRKALKGSFVFTYDMKTAFDDGVFGQVEYSPVVPAQHEDPDIAIAKAAERTFQIDKTKGLQHYLMVRTGQVNRATELKSLYESNTALRLEIITGQKSLRHVKNTLAKLDRGELDGIVCVDMLGEGFDLPNMKIAALHTPHRSLAVTLQFIGRFARTTAPNLGRATFHAIESEISVERTKLFAEGAVWQELIQNLAGGRIHQVQRAQEVVDSFDMGIELPDDFPDLSLLSLRPYFHVKILNAGQDVNLGAEVEFGNNTTVVYRQASEETQSVILITRTSTRPRWITTSNLNSIQYELVIIHYHRDTGYLFICSSKRDNELYSLFAKAYAGPEIRELRGVSSVKLNHVLSGLINPQFYNIGMRSSSRSNKEASYVTKVGSAPDQSLEQSDGRSFSRGHWFGKATKDGTEVTIGLSTASKVWSNTSGMISDLIDWCDELAEKIAHGSTPVTGSGLDYLSTGQEVESLPPDIFFVDWNKQIYTHPEIVRLTTNNGDVQCQLLDLDFSIDRNASNDQHITLVFSHDDFEFRAVFSFTNNRYIEPCCEDDVPIRLENGGPDSFIAYLNEYLPVFYTASFGYLQANTYFEPAAGLDSIFDLARIETRDWDTLGIDITNEARGVASGPISIQAGLEEELRQSVAPIVLFDHGKGEVADFLSIIQEGDFTKVTLYHCKASARRTAGGRINDLYDVCGQAVKSTNWNDPKRLLQKIRYRINTRNGRTRFVNGDLDTLNQFLFPHPARPIRLQVVIMQPGLSCKQCTDSISALLAAADEFIFGGRCERLKIIASA